MASASCAAASGDGVDQPAAEVAFVGRNAGEQVVERFPESFGCLHDSSRRLEARSLIGAGGQEFRKTGNDGQGCLQLVGKGGELRVAVTGLGFRLEASAHSSPRLCASETAFARRRTPSFAKDPADDPETRAFQGDAKPIANDRVVLDDNDGDLIVCFRQTELRGVTDAAFSAGKLYPVARSSVRRPCGVRE
jgi:hypothetical protein